MESSTGHIIEPLWKSSENTERTGISGGHSETLPVSRLFRGVIHPEAGTRYVFYLSSNFGINSDGEDGAQELHASLVQDQDPKVRAPLQPFFLYLIREHATDPVPTPQQLETRTNPRREEPRQERAPRESRLTWYLPRSHRRIHAAAVGFVRSLDSSSLLPKLERALAEMDSADSGTGTPMSPNLGSAPST